MVSVLLVFCLAAVPVFAQAAQIQHDAPACVSAGTFPLLSAEIAGDLATARVYFRCEQFQDFYFVEMASTDSGWQAVLPQPVTPPCEEIVYFIEAMDTSGETAQTAVQTTNVTSATCQATVATGPTPSITVAATKSGVAAFPPGFSEAGMVATMNSAGIVSGVGTNISGGALGTIPIVIIVAAGVGGTIAIVAATGDDDTSPTN